MVVLTELTLAATIWNRRTWIVAAPLGLALHVGILKSGLEIGLFAWFMIAVYVLVIPDVVWLWLAERSPVRALRGVVRVASGWFDGSLAYVLWVVAAGTGAVLAMLSRFDHGPGVGLWLVVALVIATAFAVVRHKTRVAALALAHLLAFSMWTLVDRATSTASDYYRFWGGSSRRLGDMKSAEHAYRRMTQVAPEDGNGFYQLGRLLLAHNADEEGIAALQRAQDLEPLRARSYVAEARWLAAHGRRDEALAKAREGAIVEPADQEAAALVQTLSAP
jgi:tetratricopeptide (TPR) repeat protein